MKKLKVISGLSFVVLFGMACTQLNKHQSTNTFKTQVPKPTLAHIIVGGDSDEQGCKASAGYLWCAKTQQCERPWELAAAKGFENSEQDFKAHCQN